MDLRGFQELLFPNLNICKELLHVQIENVLPQAPKMRTISVANRPSYSKKKTTRCVINKFIWFDLIEHSSIHQPNYRRLFHSYILSKVLIERGEQIENNPGVFFTIGAVLSAMVVAMTCSLSEVVLCADVLADAVAGGGAAPVDPPAVADGGGAVPAGSVATGELVVSTDAGGSKAEITKNNERCHKMLKGIRKTHYIQIGKLRALDKKMRHLLTYTTDPSFGSAV